MLNYKEITMKESAYRAHDTITKWLALLAVACGGVYGFLEYKDVVEKDFRKPFWEKQLDHYFDASSAASLLATSCDIHELEKAKVEFYRLFYGPLAIVEDDRVETAMVSFHDELSSSKELAVCGSTKLKNLSLDLAWKLRQSIGYTWNVQLPVLERKRNEFNK
jgi:hypothetical protein